MYEGNATVDAVERLNRGCQGRSSGSELEAPRFCDRSAGGCLSSVHALVPIAPGTGQCKAQLSARLSKRGGFGALS